MKSLSELLNCPVFGIVNTDGDPEQSVECLAGYYIQVRKIAFSIPVISTLCA